MAVFDDIFRAGKDEVNTDICRFIFLLAHSDNERGITL